jgi:ParB-like chromosome segregation protein Spo0J
MSAASEPRIVSLAMLGERLSTLRVCDAGQLGSMRRSLERHGQLTAVTLFVQGEQLEVLDGFKRVRAARALGWDELVACVDEVSVIEAKLRLRELHEGRGLSELEEAWLVRSLYREDRMSMPQIGVAFGRHKSWVWRRLMLAEALDPLVQADVRLGLLAARAAVALSRLPRGNQQAASAVVVRRGLTVRQTELLVEEVLAERVPAAREVLLARRLDGPGPDKAPGATPSRAQRSEADWMSTDILRIRELAARLEARLYATPLAVLTPAAAEVLRDALVRLVPVLRALESVIVTATHLEDRARVQQEEVA